MNILHFRHFQRGVSLLEVLIGLAIFVMLYLVALPNFQTSIQDSQIRTAAESIVNGLKLARAEAIRRNSQVQFKLVNQLDGRAVAGGTDWQIVPGELSTSGTLNFTTAMQTRSGKDGTPNARIGGKATLDFTAAAAAGAGLPVNITFNSLGRMTNTVTQISQIDVTNKTSTSARRLSIIITPGGQVRLCDPKLQLSINPQGCA